MELLIAIILLGVLSSIGFQYYRNYYDTTLAAKQTKVAVLVEQATQLKNMLELYKIKYAVDVTKTQTFTELVNQGFLTEIPAVIPDMSTTGWVLDSNESGDVTAALGSGTAAEPDIVFHYALDGSAAQIDKLDYCNAINNLASNGSTDFTVLATAIADDNTTGYTDVGNVDFFCIDNAADDETFVMVVVARSD